MMLTMGMMMTIKVTDGSSTLMYGMGRIGLVANDTDCDDNDDCDSIDNLLSK